MSNQGKTCYYTIHNQYIIHLMSKIQTSIISRHNAIDTSILYSYYDVKASF